MNDLFKRTLLYGPAAMAVGGIVWSCFFTKPAPDVATIVAGAEMMARAGALEPAEVAVKDVLKRDPRNLHAMLVKGFIEERRSDYSKAISAYERSLELNDDAMVEKDIRLSIADIRRRSGDTDGALSTIEAIEKKLGRSAATERLRGVCALDRAEYEKAIGILACAAGQKDAPADVHGLIVQCHVKRCDWTSALAETERIKAAGKDSTPYLYRIACGMAAHGDSAEAAKLLAEVVKAEPRQKSRIRKDPVWEPFLADERFRALFE